MCTVKTEVGLGYESSQVRVQVQQSQVQVQDLSDQVQVRVQQKRLKSGLDSKSGLEYYKSVL